MDTFKMIVTPEFAQRLLEKSDEEFSKQNLKQRKSRPAVYNSYAQNMAENTWMSENGEFIKITEELMIVDGYNRLNAVIQSNQELALYFVKVTIDCISTIDIGQNRSLTHVLEMCYQSCEKGAANIVTRKLTLDNGKKSVGQSKGNIGITRIKQIEEYEKHKSTYESIAKWAKGFCTERKGFTIAEVGGIYAHLMLTKHYDEQEIKDFFLNLSETAKSVFRTTYRELTGLNQTKLRGTERTKSWMVAWNSRDRDNRNLRLNECFI